MAISVKLEVFEGPLELLLYLIEKNKVNIYDIPIVMITEQYMDYIKQLHSNNLEVMSEFLVMAATLLKIKSKMLLPKVEVEEDEEDYDPRQELVERLLEYKKFKYISNELKDRQLDAEKVLFKPNTVPPELKNIKEEVNIDELLGDLTLSKLHDVFQNLLKRQEDKIDPIRSKFGRIEREEVNLSDKIRFIDRFASKNKRFSFKKLLEEQCDKIEIIVTFLGILELIKMGRIHVAQEQIFEDIMIDYNENNGELDDLDDLSFA